MSSTTTSPPPSPLRVPIPIPISAAMSSALTKLGRRHTHPRDLNFCSGSNPITHPSFSSGEHVHDPVSPRRIPLGHADRYICQGGVDVHKLLRGTRARVVDKAGWIGANVLVEESWVCRIRIPKDTRQGKFRVQIRYYASAARSSLPDPRKPVALDKVMNVPGLMTVIGRDDIVL